QSPVRFLRYHGAVEAALTNSAVGWTFVRPNLILQAYIPFAPAIAQGALQAPIGDAAVSVVDARDIAAVAAAALTEDGEGLVEDYAHYDRGEASAVSPDVAQVTGASPRSLRDFAATPSKAPERSGSIR